MESSWREFLLCAPIYAPGLVLILVALIALGADRAARRKATPTTADKPPEERPPGTGAS